MKRKVIIACLTLAIASIVWILSFSWKNPAETAKPAGNSNDSLTLIKIDNLKPNDLIKSPLKITGTARGYWYFEASFPIKLFSEDGEVIAQDIAVAQAEWTTENFVPFKATLKFSSPENDTGYLVFEKDNPSGLPEHADSIRFPVRFH